MIIRLHEEQHEEIISLWQEIFGDERWFIKSLLEGFDSSEVGWGFLADDQLVAIAFTLPLQKEEHQGSYLYGCGTKREYRGMGIQSAMIRSIIDQSTAEHRHFIVTLPAEESLFGYYSQFGFRRISLRCGSYPPDLSAPLAPCSLEEYTHALTHPTQLRHHLESHNYSAWALTTLLHEGYTPHRSSTDRPSFYTLYTSEGEMKGGVTLDHPTSCAQKQRDFMVIEPHPTDWDEASFLFPQE